tara:strand:- start:1922 stop:2101 length:180 start_codon:yes stop_codon:yes gene_type:complete
MNIRKVIMGIKKTESKGKTFLIRGISEEKWKKFRIKTIENNHKTCNDVMLLLIDRYIKS